MKRPHTLEPWRRDEDRFGRTPPERWHPWRNRHTGPLKFYRTLTAVLGRFFV